MTALVALPIGIDPDFDLAKAQKGAETIVHRAGHEVVKVLVPIYANDIDIAKAALATLDKVDLLVLTPSSTATRLGSALEKVAPLIGVQVRNLRKIATDLTMSASEDAEIAEALVATGHYFSDLDGTVRTAHQGGLSLSDAQSGVAG